MGKYKKIIIFFVTILTFLLVVLLFDEKGRYSRTIHSNWEINFFGAKRLEKIFVYNYREGEDFLIWSYDDKKFSKVLIKNKFNVIGNQNVDLVKRILSNYYNRLDSNEKSLFEESVDIDLLVDKSNYYLYKERDTLIDEYKNFVIVIARTDIKKIYYFNAIW